VTNKGLVRGLKAEVFYHKGEVKTIADAVKGAPDQILSNTYVKYGSTGNTWPHYFQKDKYGVRWTGIMVGPRQGKYYFKLNSDDGSKLWIDNKLLISNDGLHGMRTKTASTNLEKGQHWVRIDHFENMGGAGIYFTYKPPSEGWTYGKLYQPVILGFKEEAHYMGKEMKSLPNFNSHKPDMTRFVNQINYQSTGGKFPGWAHADHFCGRWTGTLHIHRRGNYRWSIISDDGSKLWINNRYIINNDGLHGMRNREANWRPGSKNSIKLEMFENKGGAGIIFRYMGADTGNRMKVVPRNRVHALGR
jgi:hypothetical protein